MMCFGLFKIFQQIWGTVKDSLKRFENYMFCISFAYLLLHVTHMQDLKKKCLPGKAAGGAKLGKMAHCPNQQQQGLFFGNFITTFVCNDTPLIIITDYIKFQVLKLI